MNFILLSIGAMLNLAEAKALTDTIILRAGENSKVIFYGKSQEDLRKLELLDLNKIIKELNEKQSSSATSPKQQVTLDNNEFGKKEAELTKRQEYVKNTFLNLHIGTGYHTTRYAFFQPPVSSLDHPTAKLTSEVVIQNLLTSSLSVLHDMKLSDRTGHTVALRYGAGLGLNIQRYLHWNLIQSVPAGDVAEVTSRGKALLESEKIMPLQSDFNAFQSFFQLGPKIALKNASGLSTFYLHLGARLNYNRLFHNAAPSIYSKALLVNSASGPTALDDGPIVTGGGYEVSARKHTFGLSYIVEIGYKWIGIFVAYYPAYVPLTTKLVAGPDRPGSGFIKDKKGDLGYVSFGVRLGR